MRHWGRSLIPAAVFWTIMSGLAVADYVDVRTRVGTDTGFLFDFLLEVLRMAPIPLFILVHAAATWWLIWAAWATSRAVGVTVGALVGIWFLGEAYVLLSLQGLHH